MMLANNNTPIEQNNKTRLIQINELSDNLPSEKQLFYKLLVTKNKHSLPSIIQKKNNSFIKNELAFLVLQKRE
jgi:hypothetical protein